MARAVNAAALVVGAIMFIWLVLDADSIPPAVFVAGAVGLALLAINAFVRLIVLLRDPDAFK